MGTPAQSIPLRPVYPVRDTEEVQTDLHTPFDSEFHVEPTPPLVRSDVDRDGAMYDRRDASQDGYDSPSQQGTVPLTKVPVRTVFNHHHTSTDAEEDDSGDDFVEGTPPPVG